MSAYNLVPTSCHMCKVNIKYGKVYAMYVMFNVSTRIWTRSISCYGYFFFVTLTKPGRLNHSLNLKLCQCQWDTCEILILNYSEKHFILLNISIGKIKRERGVFLIWFGSKRNKNCPCMRRNGWGVSVRFGLAKTSTAWPGLARDRKSVSKDWLFGIRWKKKSEKNSIQVSAPLLYKLYVFDQSCQRRDMPTV